MFIEEEQWEREIRVLAHSLYVQKEVTAKVIEEVKATDVSKMPKYYGNGSEAECQYKYDLAARKVLSKYDNTECLEFPYYKWKGGTKK